MAKKYKVHADDRFLGHYQAADGFSAIEKAIKANFNYHPEVVGQADCIFSAKKGVLGETHKYAWRNFPWLAEEFDIKEVKVG